MTNRISSQLKKKIHWNETTVVISVDTNQKDRALKVLHWHIVANNKLLQIKAKKINKSQQYKLKKPYGETTVKAPHNSTHKKSTGNVGMKKVSFLIR